MTTAQTSSHDIDTIIAEVDERGFCIVPNVISEEKSTLGEIKGKKNRQYRY